MSVSDINRQQVATADSINPARGLRKERTGKVVSAKMTKTCIVETIDRAVHQRFGKIIKHRKRYYVHDEVGRARAGDVVRIRETRRISKLKCWCLVEIIEVVS